MTVATHPPQDIHSTTDSVPLYAAVAELAAILYGDGPTEEPLATFGPIYSAAIAEVRAAFADAVEDLMRGIPGVLPQDAAQRSWEGLRWMTGAATNFRPLDLLLAQAAHTRPEPLPTTFTELLSAIGRQPTASTLRALLLRVLDAPPLLSRAERLRLHELLIETCGLDAAWVTEWRASLPPAGHAAAPGHAPATPHPVAAMHHDQALTPTADSWQILSEEGLTMLTPPAWLVNDIIPAGEVMVLAGPGDSGKTFLMIDIMNRVAQHYPVVYVAAEDAAGIRVRKRAWELHHHTAPTGNFFTIINPLPLANPLEIEKVIIAMEKIQPRLIVVDTLSQCIAGVDENSSSAMSAVLANAQRLARATNAAVVLIHHNTKDGATYRGSSVLKNNTYGFLELERDGDDIIRLECNRIKNASPFAPRYFRLIQVATDIIYYGNEPITSCVIVPASKVQRSAGDLSKTEIRILETLQVITDADNGATTTVLQMELGLRGRSFYGPLAHLRKYGYITKDGNKRTAPLIITEAGRQQLERVSTHPDLQGQESLEHLPAFEVNTHLGLHQGRSERSHGSNVEGESNSRNNSKSNAGSNGASNPTNGNASDSTHGSNASTTSTDGSNRRNAGGTNHGSNSVGGSNPTRGSNGGRNDGSDSNEGNTSENNGGIRL